MTALTKAPSMKLMKGTKKTVEAETVVAAAETQKADVSEGQALATEDLIVVTAHEIENLKEDKAFKMVPQLLNNIDHDYFRLGGVLSVIQNQGWYMDKKHESFRSFVESDCNIAYRKAMYLIEIYNGLVESGVQWEQVKHLGWTKLKELAKFLTTENVEDWVAIAESLTVLQLIEHIKEQSAGTGNAPEGGVQADASEASKTTTVTFKLHKDQKETVLEAIDKAKLESKTEVATVALEYICLDFLGSSKLKAIPTLSELMTGKTPEEVLGVFQEVFPDVSLEVTL